MRPYDLSIGQRLALGFGALLLILAGGLAIVFYSHERSDTAQQRLVEQIAPQAQAIEELERALLNLAVQVRRQLLFPDGSRLAAFHAGREQLLAALEDVRLAPRPASEDQQFNDVADAVEEFEREADRLVERHRRTGVSTSDEIALSEKRETAFRLLRELRLIGDRKQASALAALQRARDRANTAMLVAAVLMVLLCLALAVLITRSLRRPLRELRTVASALQVGDWQPALAAGRAVPVAPRSEIAEVARGFAAAAAALARRERRLAAEGQVVSATSSTLDHAALAAAALAEIVGYVEAEVGVVYWQQPGSDRMQPLARHGLGEDIGSIRIGEGLPGQAAADRRVLVSRAIPRETPFHIGIGYDAAPPHCVIAAPMVFADTAQGVLLVAALRDLDDDAAAFLGNAAAHLGVALRNADSYAAAQRLLAEVRANRELIQAQNEELQSQNEELQAQSEELQAQAEAIQAQNEELRQQGDELQRHVSDLAATGTQKDQFLALLAHELRNPLAAISNSLFVLRRGADGPDAQAARDAIARQTEHLTRLIDDLLDASRIAQGKIQLQRRRLDLNEIVRVSADDFRPALERAGLTLTLALHPDPVWVDGDYTRLCQVLSNLLTNAIKFTPRGGRLALSVRRADGSAAVHIADTGIGIEPGQLTRLFEPFTQGSGADGNVGLGLGLSLVKGLVELHGGRVDAHSDGHGTGTEFVVELPLADGGKPANPPAPPAPVALARRILIIEDNRDAADSLCTALRLEGHHVEVAYSSHDGLARLASYQPEIVLCDLGLPDMDGYELARRVREQPTLKSVLLVALSGYAAPADRQRAAAAGFHHHLAKPVSIEHLSRFLAGV